MKKNILHLVLDILVIIGVSIRLNNIMIMLSAARSWPKSGITKIFSLVWWQYQTPSMTETTLGTDYWITFIILAISLLATVTLIVGLLLYSKGETSFIKLNTALSVVLALIIFSSAILLPIK